MFEWAIIEIIKRKKPGLLLALTLIFGILAISFLVYKFN